MERGDPNHGDCHAAIRANVRILAGRVLAEDQSYSVSTLIRKLYVLHQGRGIDTTSEDVSPSCITGQMGRS